MTRSSDPTPQATSRPFPPVCILTAGQGTRLGPYAHLTNKALLPIRGRAILSHLIESFPPGTPFVLGLGHRGEEVRSYVELAHPELDVKFITVDRFQGQELGLATR